MAKWVRGRLIGATEATRRNYKEVRIMSKDVQPPLTFRLTEATRRNYKMLGEVLHEVLADLLNGFAEKQLEETTSQASYQRWSLL